MAHVRVRRGLRVLAADESAARVVARSHGPRQLDARQQSARERALTVVGAPSPPNCSAVLPHCPPGQPPTPSVSEPNTRRPRSAATFSLWDVPTRHGEARAPSWIWALRSGCPGPLRCAAAWRPPSIWRPPIGALESRHRVRRHLSHPPGVPSGSPWGVVFLGQAPVTAPHRRSCLWRSHAQGEWRWVSRHNPRVRFCICRDPAKPRLPRLLPSPSRAGRPATRAGGWPARLV